MAGAITVVGGGNNGAFQAVQGFALLQQLLDNQKQVEMAEKRFGLEVEQFGLQKQLLQNQLQLQQNADARAERGEARADKLLNQNIFESQHRIGMDSSRFARESELADRNYGLAKAQADSAIALNNQQVSLLKTQIDAATMSNNRTLELLQDEKNLRKLGGEIMAAGGATEQNLLKYGGDVMALSGGGQLIEQLIGQQTKLAQLEEGRAKLDIAKTELGDMLALTPEQRLQLRLEERLGMAQPLTEYDERNLPRQVSPVVAAVGRIKAAGVKSESQSGEAEQTTAGSSGEPPIFKRLSDHVKSRNRTANKLLGETSITEGKMSEAKKFLLDTPIDPKTGFGVRKLPYKILGGLYDSPRGMQYIGGLELKSRPKNSPYEAEELEAIVEASKPDRSATLQQVARFNILLSQIAISDKPEELIESVAKPGMFSQKQVEELYALTGKLGIDRSKIDHLFVGGAK